VITDESNRVLKVSKFIKSNTKSSDPIIIYGYGWSSEIPFYSERRANGDNNYGAKGDVDSIVNYEKYLTSRPSAVVLCPISNMQAEREAIKLKFGDIKPAIIEDCEIYLVN
jgi:hypothetical protein